MYTLTKPFLQILYLKDSIIFAKMVLLVYTQNARRIIEYAKGVKNNGKTNP